ncbi:DUF397 domain-containing protein [Streptomyces sp. NPDC093094]|uniref:DUF397 domain-containing protein n=1 Tax=Streptomyces sp. NPDC093094 TaxID=3366026 RepID=UPI00380806FC
MTLSASEAPTGLEWTKSSYSGADTPSCVEVAAAPGRVLVRDSKNPHGPRLALTPASWAAFLPYTGDREATT